MARIEVTAEEPPYLPLNGASPDKKFRGKTQAAEVLLDGIDTVRIFPGLGFFRFSEGHRGIHIAFVEEALAEGSIRVFKGAREVRPNRRKPFNKDLFLLELHRGRNRVAARYVNTNTGQAIRFNLNHQR